MEQKTTCPKCSSQNPVGQQFCGACGAKLADEMQQDLNKVMGQLVKRYQIKVKPTWDLAWGLYWRMLLLGLLVAGTLYFIAMIIVLALGLTVSPWF
ncbi:MAG TPA: zinc ribbon domain-containing protein [Dehalococcoidia bacterium]|nr:zinc ribbon domain-containing protein [Dehalococcoidia bacterium]